MQLVTYFELNEDLPAAEKIEAIREQGLADKFPAEGVELLNWGITPDQWGFVIIDADDPEKIHTGLNTWRYFQPWFEVSKTAPFLSIEDAIQADTRALEEF